LFDALNASSDVLVKFGGHELAAGLTVTEENIELFRKTINEYAANCDVPFQKVKVDCRLKPRALTLDVAKSLKAFEPYGAGNSTPVFGIMESQLVGIQSLANGKHTRLKLRRENTDFGAVMLGTSPDELPFKVGDMLDLAVTLDVNVYNNTESVSVIVRAVRKSGFDDEIIENQLSALEKFYCNSANVTDAQSICPERSDIAVVFRYLRTNDGVLQKRLENDLMTVLPIGKITVAVQALCELKLAEICDEKVKLLPFEGKADLESADILKKLKSMIGGDR
jgi:single-stranded-DNA-specific exonuclease